MLQSKLLTLLKASRSPLLLTVHIVALMLIWEMIAPSSLGAHLLNCLAFVKRLACSCLCLTKLSKSLCPHISLWSYSSALRLTGACVLLCITKMLCNDKGPGNHIVTICTNTTCWWQSVIAVCTLISQLPSDQRMIACWHHVFHVHIANVLHVTSWQTIKIYLIHMCFINCSSSFYLCGIASQGICLAVDFDASSKLVT